MWKDNPSWVYYVIYNYGATKEEAERLAAQRGQPCPVCNERAAHCVDHDHDTGKIRALLCGKCNTGLGMLKDNPAILERAISYLRSHTKLTS